MIIIKNWYGRLGNNIIQICNAIHIALYYKEQIQLPPHTFFNTNIIKEYFKNNNNKLKIENNISNLYHRHLLKDIPNEVFEINIEKVHNLLKKAFIIKQNEFKKIDENDIIIHIRSGDVFSNNPHGGYTPPPLAYYTNILDNNKFNKIIIVCEDKINPVIDKLLKIYPNSVYNKNSLKDDIKIILGATTIISSVGTFIPSLKLLSDNIKKIYSTSLYSEELKNYYLYNSPWKNTKFQRDLILNYKINGDILKDLHEISQVHALNSEQVLPQYNHKINRIIFDKKDNFSLQKYIEPTNINKIITKPIISNKTIKSNTKNTKKTIKV
jgi:hypothetical protein